MCSANKRIKISLFLPSLPFGGVEQVMINLARNFEERGIKVDMVLARAEGEFLSKVPKNVRVVDLHARGPKTLASLPSLIAYLRKERPNAILSAMDHVNIVALWARKLSCVPCRLVVSSHGTLSVVTANDPNKRARFVPRLVAWFYPWADAIVTVSKGVAEDLSRTAGLSAERIKVIHNPVVTPELFVKSKEPLEHPWFVHDQPPVVLSVGRLTSAKDYSTLIKAFALVRANLPARLMILGEGEERVKLEMLIRELRLEEDVLLPGYVDNPYKYMAHAAAFVLSSAWEGFGNVLVESMSLGTPVIATDCPGGPTEILENGKWGRVVEVGNSRMLADAIIGTIINQTDNAGIVNRAMDFTLEKISDEYLQVLLY